MATAARKKPAAKRTPAKLRPRTKPAEPNEGRATFSLPARSAGVRVTEDTALTLGAVWACFPPGTLVKRASGEVSPIEDFRPGDEVVTHLGRHRKVTEVLNHAYNGELVAVRRWGASGEIEVTADHLFYVVRRGTRREWWSDGWREGGRADLSYEWVKASELQPGDFLTEPIPSGEVVPGPVEIAVRRRAGNDGQKARYAEVAELVRLTPALFRLIGYYLAEGWCEKRSVRFALHEKETDIAEELASLGLEHFGVTAKLYPDAASGRGTVVGFNNTKAVAFFKLFGKGAKGKFLPEWVLTAPVSWQVELLKTYWAGDGCHRPDGYNIASAGRQLIEGVRTVALRLGMVPSLRTERRNVKLPQEGMIGRILHTLSFTGKNAKRFAELLGEPTPCSADREYCFIANGFAHYPIRSVESSTEVLTVHNLEVEEDHSYIAAGVGAHNCVRVITEDIAGLPWHVLERKGNGPGSVEVPDDPAEWLLHTQASPDTPAFQFRETILAHALTWGNGYAEIERDLAGRPAWLWLITPDRVTPQRDGDQIVYVVTNPTGPATVLSADDMFHVHGLGYDGLVGYSVIQLAARSIGAGIALDQSTSDLFANDSTPGGLLKHPGRLNDSARANLAASWERRHAGPNNRRRVAILEEGMDWQQTGLPPEDTKLIEQRQFTPADICRWFRVNPPKIFDLSHATFSNIEELGIWHVTDTLTPWVRRLETVANIKLFGRTNRGRRFTKINMNALMRGNVAARTAAYTAMLDRGVNSVNEVRELEDLNPIGPDGDKRFVPLNMQLLENAGEEPPAPPEPTQPPPDPSQPDGNPPEPGGDPSQPPGDSMPPNGNMRAALRPVFEDACRRLLRTETERAKGPLRSGAQRAVEWFNKVKPDHAAYVRTALRPAVSALALARGASPEEIEASLSVVANRHLDGLADRLAGAVSDPATCAEWELLAGNLAANLIDQLAPAVEVRR